MYSFTLKLLFVVSYRAKEREPTRARNSLSSSPTPSSKSSGSGIKMYDEISHTYPWIRNWYMLGKLYYLRKRVDTISWIGQLSDEKVERKISPRNRFVAFQFSLYRIHICTLDGKFLGSIISKEEILQFGWLTESIVVVFDQNCIQVYDLTDLSYKLCETKLPTSFKNLRSYSFDGYGNVFVCSEECQLFVMFNMHIPQKLHCEIQVIDREHSRAKIISALNKRSMLHEDNDIHYIIFYDHIKSYLRRTGEVFTISCQGNIICAELSPGKGLLATYSTFQGRYILEIYSTNYLNLDSVIKVDMGIYVKSSRASQLSWCGENAVAIMSDSNVLQLCSIDGGRIDINIGVRAKIVSEIDGLHVVGFQFREFFQEVPSPIVESRERNRSFQPFLQLRECEKEKNGVSDLHLHSEDVNDSNPMNNAIFFACAALHEMNAGFQMKALQTASCYSALSCTRGNNIKDLIHSSCRELRVLNSLRKARGISFTYLQYQEWESFKTKEKCLSRNDARLSGISLSFSSRKYVQLQFLMQKYLQRKLSKSFKQEFLGLCNSLLLKHPSVSLCIILGTRSVLTAQDLYFNIINLENCVFWQLEALMNLRTHGIALTRAFEFKDMDLIYRVLLCFGERLSLEGVLSIIESNSTYFKYSRLKYLHFPEFRPGFLVDSVFGYGQLKLIEQFRSDFPLKFIFYSKLMREFIRISKVCRRYSDADFRNSTSFFLGLKNDFEIKKFSSSVQISDRHLQWIFARFYIKVQDWNALHSVVVSNKADLNTLSILEYGKNHFIPDQSAERIMRLSGRADYLAEVDFKHDTQEALQVASKSVQSFTLKATDYFEKFKMKK